jgi:hypothetical protein
MREYALVKSLGYGENIYNIPPMLLIAILIVPIQRIVKHLWPRRPQLPSKLQVNILHEMARDLDIPHIRRVPQRSDIIVLQDPRRVKIVHKGLIGAARFAGWQPPFQGVARRALVRARQVRGAVEVLVYVPDLGDKGGPLDISVALFTKSVPEGLLS